MKRCNRIPVACVLATIAVALVAGPVGLAGQAAAQGPNRVGLVVRFSEENVFTDCVEFSQSEISGCEVLDLSGLSVSFSSPGTYGQAVCGIEGVGCEPSKCFCECAGAECVYWAYYHLTGRKWQYSPVGCSSHSVSDGDVEGWAWGPGTFGAASEVEPPLISFQELCPEPTATPEPSPPVVEFAAEPGSIASGQCSTVRWSVKNAGIVTLNGAGVLPEDARYVCPEETQTFELIVLNAAGEYSYELTIEVAQPTATPPPTATPTVAPSSTPGVTSASPPSPTSTAIPVEPASSPPAPPTPRPTVVAIAPTATTTIAWEEETDVAEPGDVAGVEATNTATVLSDPAHQETVGMDRILLLLGVGAGTLGFGTLAFIAITVLLVLIYVRARAQF